MSEERKSAKKSLEDFAAGEVANFWLSHTIHSGLAPLQHHLHSKRSHPEQLYTDLARLAGALCTFSLDSHPRDLPSYDHDNLQVCFDALDRHIRANLDILAPTNCIRVPLQPIRELLHTGKVTDRRAFGTSQWIIGVRSEVESAQVIRDLPRVVKVCSAVHIARLVKEALPGLPLVHMPVPPAAVSPQPGAQYFALTRQGPCWASTVETEEIGVFIPHPFSSSRLELIVILES